MSILTLLVALLLSGSNGFTVHTNSVSGGGPTGAPQAAPASSNAPTVDDVISGGPTSGPHTAKPSPGLKVDDVILGGPTS